MPTVVYAEQPETIIRGAARVSASARNHVLMGTWLEVLAESGAWYEVKPRPNRGKGGWVRKTDTRLSPILKVFVVDVGQGDGAIVEAPNGRILIDGGPNKGYYNFLRHRYRPLIEAGETIHFDAVVVSHPDMDHFRGLTYALNDPDFTFGTLFHNGIIRYNDDQPSGIPFDLGQLNGDGSVLTETFDDLDDAGQLIAGGELMTTFRDFWTAARTAQQAGRLQRAKRITNRNATLTGFGGIDPEKLRIEILGPVPTAQSGLIRYRAFPDPHDHPSPTASSSHTRNGHSIVLKLLFGKHSFLFGGDLNIPAEQHLLAHYGAENPFRVDVAKACHHGSSDFSIDFLKQIKPQVNVFSSGDNKSFDHPTADAVGAAARWTRGSLPLFFSTELGRAQSSSGTHYGLVNLRSNGKTLVAAQLKEQHKKADVWDSFTVPWGGKFPDAL
jgi:phosphoribosyl 1,2-cyclic phosphodiesterase